MIKREKESEVNKDALIKKIIGSVNKGCFKESVSFIRGKYSVTEPWHLIAINENKEHVASLRAVVNASRKHKDSRHQIDYVVFSFINQMAFVTVQKEEIPTSNHFVKKLEELEKRETQNTLILVVMSENDMEISNYDVVESKDSMVISEKPTLSYSMMKSKSAVVMGRKILENVMKISKENSKLFKKDLHTMGLSFTGDEKLFPTPSDFIEKRNEKKLSKKPKKTKKTNKFGY